MYSNRFSENVKRERERERERQRFDNFKTYRKEVKGIPLQAEVALRVPGRLRSQIFSTFRTTRVVGRQPNAPAAFTPGEIPGAHFQRLSRPQGTWFCRKKSQVTPPGIDRGTVRLVARRISHYATPSPRLTVRNNKYCD